jgi:DNA-binding NtrC family response regulator
VSTALLMVPGPGVAAAVVNGLPKDWRAEVLPTGEEGLERLAAGGIDLVVADLNQRGLRGQDLLTRVRTIAPWTPVILVLPAQERDQAPSYLALGASDFVLTPILPMEVRVRVESALARSPRRPSPPLTKVEEAFLLGPSPAMASIREQMAVVAPTDIPILVLGESGTGRGVLARQIHFQSPRAKSPFVVVNCVGTQEELFEKEFFGSAGEEDPRPGALEEGAGGTLYLDEIADLSPPFQVKLLKLMREREFARVGGGEAQPANVRFIFASSRDLSAEMAARRFREDFYYRIQTFPIRVPPLRERTEDIPVLSRAFLQSYCRELGKPFEGFDQEAMDCLLWYSWPGNVRELQNRMRFCSVYLKGPVLKKEDLPVEIQSVSGLGMGTYPHARMQFEREYLARLLRKHRGNVNRIAMESGKQRVELYRMFKRCGLDPRDFRGPR